MPADASTEDLSDPDENPVFQSVGPRERSRPDDRSMLRLGDDKEVSPEERLRVEVDNPCENQPCRPKDALVVPVAKVSEKRVLPHDTRSGSLMARSDEAWMSIPDRGAAILAGASALSIIQAGSMPSRSNQGDPPPAHSGTVRNNNPLGPRKGRRGDRVAFAARIKAAEGGA